jgi:predicted ester cyclase
LPSRQLHTSRCGIGSIGIGVPHGGKGFKVMSIDVHTIRDGKMVRAFHVEDRMGAARQLSAK